jgi:hypothetical protein
MPFANFSIGKDVVVDIITPQGVLALPVTTTSFDAKPEYNKIASVGLDGINREVSIPKGWRGTLTLDRQNNAVDAFFAKQEAGYYGGQNVLTGTITETIRESDGSVSQYRYVNVSLSFDDAGKKTGDNKIEQHVGFFASQRQQVA